MSRLFYVTIFSLALSVVAATNVRHIELNDAHLVDYGQVNFALSSPELEDKGWFSVVVNGNDAVVIKANCEHIFMSDASQFKAIRDQLNSIDPVVLDSSARHSSSMYPLDEARVLPNRSKNIEFDLIQQDDLVVHRDSDGNVAAAGSLLPGYSRVFILENAVVFVNTDGSIDAMPRDCLNDDQLDVVDSILRRI